MLEKDKHQEYFARFQEDKDFYLKDDKISNRAIVKAFETALDTRKFEIELYWKRATYFWAFIAAMFVAYFAVLNSDNVNEFKGITILISILGFFFSLGWYFVNRGSKYWQENWEAHVDRLGEKVQGKLFRTIKKSNQNFLNLNQEYPFSVSKVNQQLSLIMVICWFCIFIFSFFYSFDKLVYVNEICNCCFSLIIILSIFSLVFLSYIFFRNSKSFLLKHKFVDIDDEFIKTD
jgi:hypothetical protein